MREGLDRLEDRTKKFTIDTIRLCIKLEALPGLRSVTWQLTDASGSVGSNHRAMRRARSDREFAAKLQIVNEEIDESVFWLEVVQAVYPDAADELPILLSEGLELRSIFAKARSTNRARIEH
jgi:four helix bundle protein